MVETVPDRTDVARPAPPLPDEAEILARSGGENFVVASRLLPPRSRSRLLALYGYARLVDQVGDDYPGDRLAALDQVETGLDAALAGRPGDAHPLVARAVEALGLSGRVSQAADEPASAPGDRRDAGPGSGAAGEAALRALIEANRLDQAVGRYATFEDLLGYCRLSADPVGRLVLIAFDQATPERFAWSDRICTGLQLVEHWQDVAEDARSGRIYLPLEDLDRFGVTEDDVAEAAGWGRAGTALRALVGFESARARSWLLAGAPLVDSLRGAQRAAVAGFLAGGLAAVDALAATGFDPWAGAPRPRRSRAALHWATVLRPARGRP